MADYISVYPPSHNSTYVKVTSDGYESDCFLATDPTQPLTGNASGNAWGSEASTNQRFHIDLGSSKIVTNIYYENFHHEGGNTNTGVQSFTIWGSNEASAFAELTYATDTDWTQITAGENHFDVHASADSADPKFISLTNSTAYRYYALKFSSNYGNEDAMGLRRIELQTDEPNNFATIVETLSFNDSTTLNSAPEAEIIEDLTFGDEERYPESFADTETESITFADVITYTVVEPFRIFIQADQTFPLFSSDSQVSVGFQAAATFPLFSSESHTGNIADSQEMPKFDVSGHMTITPLFEAEAEFPEFSSAGTMTMGKVVNASSTYSGFSSSSTFVTSPVVTASGNFVNYSNSASMSIAGRFIDYVLRYIR